MNNAFVFYNGNLHGQMLEVQYPWNNLILTQYSVYLINFKSIVTSQSNIYSGFVGWYGLSTASNTPHCYIHLS